ncbi:hypothetical protein V6N13_050460 [Hibiscus sabdariffa]
MAWEFLPMLVSS